MHMLRLIPLLPVKSMPTSIAYYEKLGFAVETRNDEWGWAMLRWGDDSSECRLMLDESINVQPDAPRQHVVYFYPENVVEYHQQLRAAGLTVPDLDVTFYGMTEFRLHDPDGNPLWIGQSTPSPDSQ